MKGTLRPVSDSEVLLACKPDNKPHYQRQYSQYEHESVPRVFASRFLSHDNLQLLDPQPSHDGVSSFDQTD